MSEHRPAWQRIAANAVSTAVCAVAVSLAMLTMITVQTDATSAITPGTALHRDKPIVMEAEDRAAFPGCYDIRAWEQNMPARKVLVVRSNGTRALMDSGAAFDQIAESKKRPELSIWVIGACPR